VYEGFYGEMAVPATAYANTTSVVQGREAVPSVRTVASNASVVDRHDRLDGIISTGGRFSRKEPTPEINDNVDSSKFQRYLIGPQVNYIINDKWYIAYPAATY
jgi:hypothetical protein